MKTTTFKVKTLLPNGYLEALTNRISETNGSYVAISRPDEEGFHIVYFTRGGTPVRNRDFEVLRMYNTLVLDFHEVKDRNQNGFTHQDVLAQMLNLTVFFERGKECHQMKMARYRHAQNQSEHQNTQNMKQRVALLERQLAEAKSENLRHQTQQKLTKAENEIRQLKTEVKQMQAEHNERYMLYYSQWEKARRLPSDNRVLTRGCLVEGDEARTLLQKDEEIKTKLEQEAQQLHDTLEKRKRVLQMQVKREELGEMFQLPCMHGKINSDAQAIMQGAKVPSLFEMALNVAHANRATLPQPTTLTSHGCFVQHEGLCEEQQ